eukprot:864518-Alexandrium_andersonii.AAC.1
MSASLVGSEMCIRDRGGHQAPTRRPPPENPGEAATGGGHRAPTRRSPGAVSYTHLTLPTICSV